MTPILRFFDGVGTPFEDILSEAGGVVGQGKGGGELEAFKLGEISWTQRVNRFQSHVRPQGRDKATGEGYRDNEGQ
jgi:hypothetical protein